MFLRAIFAGTELFPSYVLRDSRVQTMGGEALMQGIPLAFC